MASMQGMMIPVLFSVHIHHQEEAIMMPVWEWWMIRKARSNVLNKYG